MDQARLLEHGTVGNHYTLVKQTPNWYIELFATKNGLSRPDCTIEVLTPIYLIILHYKSSYWVLQLVWRELDCNLSFFNCGLLNRNSCL